MNYTPGFMIGGTQCIQYARITRSVTFIIETRHKNGFVFTIQMSFEIKNYRDLLVAIVLL